MFRGPPDRVLWYVSASGWLFGYFRAFAERCRFAYSGVQEIMTSVYVCIYVYIYIYTYRYIYTYVARHCLFFGNVGLIEVL